MQLRRFLTACTAVAALAAIAVPSAQAADQLVTGTTTGSLGLNIPATPVPLTGGAFTPGQTATGTGVVPVVATGPWVLRVKDTDTTSVAQGHMLADSTVPTCTGSTPSLANALQASLSGTGVTSVGTIQLSSSDQQVASGSLSATLTSSYSQAFGSSELLKTGCVYKVTATYTLSSS